LFFALILDLHNAGLLFAVYLGFYLHVFLDIVDARDELGEALGIGELSLSYQTVVEQL